MPNLDPAVTPPQDIVPPPNATPPQQPGEIGSAEPAASWPTIIGVISIVFGAGGCLSGVWGFFAPQLLEALADKMPQAQRTQLEVAQSWHTWTVILSAVTILIAIVLLVCGIELVRRRRRGIKIGRIWAVLKIIFAVVGSYVGYFIMQDQFRQMPQQNTPVGGNLTALMGLMGIVFGVLWGCAYPVFLLIWFARGKVKTEYTKWR